MPHLQRRLIGNSHAPNGDRTGGGQPAALGRPNPQATFASTFRQPHFRRPFMPPFAGFTINTDAKRPLKPMDDKPLLF